MSEYGLSADVAESQLKEISPTMCYAKWLQVSLHLTNGRTHSCYHPPTHIIPLEDLKRNPSVLHNTSQKKMEREQMLNGEKPEGCSYCWNIEATGNRSDRIYRSGEYWAQNGRRDIEEASSTGDVRPRYVEVNFNQACNFKCMYCSPHLSHSWEEDVHEHGPFMITNQSGHRVGHNDIVYLEKEQLMPFKGNPQDNPYVEAFWKWWPDIYRHLEVFRLTGGEPLIDANTYKILDFIYEHPNAWLELSITSNLCPPKSSLFETFVEKLQNIEKTQVWHDPLRFNPGSGNNWYVNNAVKHTSIFVSLDSVGSQAEYIRDGLQFDLLQKNVRHLLDNTIYTTVTFINTFNALSVPRFEDFLAYILSLRREYAKSRQGIRYVKIDVDDPYMTHPDREVLPVQRVWFDIPLLRYPDWQSIQVLPNKYVSYMENAIQFMEENQNVDDFVGFYDFEIDKAKRNWQWMKERSKLPITEIRRHKKNFIDFYKQYDLRRNKNFIKTFPELAELLHD